MFQEELTKLLQSTKELQENMRNLQDELAVLEVQGESGAGLVKAVMNCQNKVKQISIDDSLLRGDKEMLEDLIAAAINDGVRKAVMISVEKMNAVTGNTGELPPGFKLPI